MLVLGVLAVVFVVVSIWAVGVTTHEAITREIWQKSVRSDGKLS